MYVLVLPGPASDLTGIALGLAAAGCWAGYIVVNRLVGTRLDGLQAPALASGLCALGYLPVLLLTTTVASWTLPTVVRSLATGLLSSVVPYAADLTALRTVPPRLFGILASAQPVLAALTGCCCWASTSRRTSGSAWPSSSPPTSWRSPVRPRTGGADP